MKEDKLDSKVVYLSDYRKKHNPNLLRVITLPCQIAASIVSILFGAVIVFTLAYIPSFYFEHGSTGTFTTHVTPFLQQVAGILFLLVILSAVIKAIDTSLQKSH